MSRFTPKCLPVLIGSLPHRDHQEAVELVFAQTPHIPLWPQLPFYKEEGMLLQFLPGMPGITSQQDKIFIDTSTSGFEAELLAFFEEYIGVTEGEIELESSRFTLSPVEAAGFHVFLREAARRADSLVALKGQVTGPITFCTGLVDQDGRALFYDEQTRDIALKLLSLKARYQTRMMAKIKPRPLVFFDEPGLAGFGSSAYITITPEDISACFSEVFAGVKEEGGLTGVHVCANTEWPIIFNSDVDIVSFDAYSYFDKLMLFPDQLRAFLLRGSILASGIVPTSPEYIELENSSSLVDKWYEQLQQLEGIGIAKELVFEQTLITPSCGTGTVTLEQAERVAKLTREVSQTIRQDFEQ
jgi:hypothetical protein